MRLVERGVRHLQVCSLFEIEMKKQSKSSVKIVTNKLISLPIISVKWLVFITSPDSYVNLLQFETDFWYSTWEIKILAFSNLPWDSWILLLFTKLFDYYSIASLNQTYFLIFSSPWPCSPQISIILNHQNCKIKNLDYEKFGLYDISPWETFLPATFLPATFLPATFLPVRHFSLCDISPLRHFSLHDFSLLYKIST